MSGYPYRLQAIWIMVLALAWLGFCSPWSVGLNLLLAVSVVGAAIVAIGRAANRRVEITLIPDCRDDDGSRSTQGRPACS